MSQKTFRICKKLIIVFLFAVLILWYKHIANLYINPENAIRQYGKNTNQDVIDFIKFEEGNQLYYIFCTEYSLKSMKLQKNFLGLWHLTSTGGSSLLKKEKMHPSFKYDILELSNSTVIYGYTFLDDIKEARLTIDNHGKTTAISFLFENNSNLFWFDLGIPYASCRKIELELINQEAISVSQEILFRNKLLN